MECFSSGCAIQLHSVGYEDRGFLKNGFIGSISVGNVHDLRGFAHIPFVKHSRIGIFLVTLWRPEQYCEVIQSASYDTYSYASAARSLDGHFRYNKLRFWNQNLVQDLYFKAYIFNTYNCV